MSCLYILEINCLSVASFTIIFSHSEGCLSILFILSFVVENVCFISFHLFIFVFISINLAGRSEFESVVVRWMNLETLIQTVACQKEKCKYHIWNLEKWY